jgi:phenylpyruvate tautomerase PptA (4-oxalocrotonate tautomerase family)
MLIKRRWEVHSMPLLQVYYHEGLLEKKVLKQISEQVHAHLITYFHIPKEDYFQLYIPYPSGQFFYDPNYLLPEGTKRTENLIYFALTCGPGRTFEQKKALYHAIAASVNKLTSISTADVFITLNETAAENWSFGQGLAQMVKERNERNE